MQTWLTSDEAASLSEDQIEDQIQERGREMLRLMLQAHIHERGSGDVGPALQVYSPPTPDATPNDAEDQSHSIRHGEKRHHDRTLRTVFGKVRVARTAYVAAGHLSVHPLDEQLQLPERSFSYPLQERLVRHAVQGPFDEAVADVERDTGVRLSKRSAEQVIQEAAIDFQAFYRQHQVMDAGKTGPIVVTGIDCKGVPMIKPEENLRKVRRGKGDKKQKKRMATVATVRTQPVRVRTPEEVVEKPCSGRRRRRSRHGSARGCRCPRSTNGSGPT